MEKIEKEIIPHYPLGEFSGKEKETL